MDWLILMFIPMLTAIKPFLNMQYTTPLTRTADVLAVALLTGSLLGFNGFSSGDALSSVLWVSWFVGLVISVWRPSAFVFCDIAGAATIGCFLSTNAASATAMLLMGALYVSANIVYPVGKRIYGIIRAKR